MLRESPSSLLSEQYNYLKEHKVKNIWIEISFPLCLRLLEYYFVFFFALQCYQHIQMKWK